jgi:septum formation protein
MNANDILYLASASPRRRELLAQLALHVERIHADIDESVRAGETALAYVERLALAKADAGWAVVDSCGLPERALLAADTTVTLDGEIFGKPENPADACRMLRAFSGRTHQVITSVAVRNAERHEQLTSVTEVTFCALSDDAILRYVDSGEVFDKAGAYGIQGKAAVFVARIDGSFSGVVGLPLFETSQLLGRVGFVFP